MDQMRFRPKSKDNLLIPGIMAATGLLILFFTLPGWVWLALIGLGLIAVAAWVYKKGF